MSPGSVNPTAARNKVEYDDNKHERRASRAGAHKPLENAHIEYMPYAGVQEDNKQGGADEDAQGGAEYNTLDAEMIYPREKPVEKDITSHIER
jgi:hypothetical protein